MWGSPLALLSLQSNWAFRVLSLLPRTPAAGYGGSIHAYFNMINVAYTVYSGPDYIKKKRKKNTMQETKKGRNTAAMWRFAICPPFTTSIPNGRSTRSHQLLCDNLTRFVVPNHLAKQLQSLLKEQQVSLCLIWSLRIKIGTPYGGFFFFFFFWNNACSLFGCSKFSVFLQKTEFPFSKGKKKTLMDKPFRNPGPSVAGEITFYKRSRGQRWAGQN